ncbi:MAG TPA: Uma2 family endonuclease [Candidatus Acidoferrales bacterium]|nr:Uma2 family endonuclease [Candidatus Acidoferrales bacterium]
MTVLLEMPAFRERVHRLSMAEYHRAGETGLLSDDVELLRGIVVTKMSKFPLHELVVQKLMKRLLAQIPDGFEVRREGPLTLRDSEPEPDLSVVRGTADDWAVAHPSTAHLVIEVAVSSLPLDEGKAEIYAEAGILEYWLVRPENRAVDVYREPASDGYLSKTTLIEPEILRCANIPEIEIGLAEILPVRS